MIWANHSFAKRGLNVLDENGNEGCAHCGRPRDVHPDGRPAILGYFVGMDDRYLPPCWCQRPTTGGCPAHPSWNKDTGSKVGT
jgi:hypothetical protein